MRTLRHFLIIITTIEVILSGLLVVQLSTSNELMASDMLPGAVRVLVCFVAMLCLLLFLDGILYMQQMNRSVETLTELKPMYECETMIEAIDLIDDYVPSHHTDSSQSVTKPKRTHAAA